MSDLRATYRLQLGPGLGFREARELVSYLRDLGVSHLYLSPSLRARLQQAHVWHINADEAPLFDYALGDSPLLQYAADAYRASDHDPLLLVLRPPTR